MASQDPSTTPSSTPTSSPTASSPTLPSSPSTSSQPTPPPTSSSGTTSTDSATTSSSPTSTNAPTQTTEQLTSLTEVLSTTEGVVVTRTSTAIISGGTRPVAPSTSTSSSSGSKSFFHNKGAVAGVFVVVGLIVAALIFALITNVIRRRRAKAFDRELQEATREAAAAPAPAFLDDDDDDGYGRHGPGSAGYSGYGASSNERQLSDLSHGTYAQNPMSHAETYNMRELGPGTGVGEIYDPYAATATGAAGAAGIGVARARSMKSDPNVGNSYASALADGSSPYAAFARPQGYNTPPMPGAGAGMGGGDPFGATAAQKNLEILEAAGMGSHVAGAGAVAVNSLSRSQSQQRDQQPSYGYPSHPQPVQRRTSQGPNEYDAVQQSLERGKSFGSSGHSHEQGSNSSATGATQFYSPGVAGAYGSTPQNQSQPAYNPQSRWSSPNEDEEDAYGGFSAPPAPPASNTSPTGGLPNPFTRATSAEGHGREWDRDSRSSAYSQEEPRRVLKVANE